MNKSVEHYNRDLENRLARNALVFLGLIASSSPELMNDDDNVERRGRGAGSMVVANVFVTDPRRRHDSYNHNALTPESLFSSFDRREDFHRPLSVPLAGVGMSMARLHHPRSSTNDFELILNSIDAVLDLLNAPEDEIETTSVDDKSLAGSSLKRKYSEMFPVVDDEADQTFVEDE